MEPANIRQDTSAVWDKLIKPTYRAHLFDEVSTPLTNLTGHQFVILLSINNVSLPGGETTGKHFLFG